MTLKERLLNKLIESTKTIKNKRIAEYQLHRCFETVLTIITVLAIISVITFKGWAFWVALILWGLMLYGWNALSSMTMKMMLGILYPEGETEAEMQEIQLDNLFGKIDNLIKQFNED